MRGGDRRVAVAAPIAAPDRARRRFTHRHRPVGSTHTRRGRPRVRRERGRVLPPLQKHPLLHPTRRRRRGDRLAGHPGCRLRRPRGRRRGAVQRYQRGRSDGPDPARPARRGAPQGRIPVLPIRQSVRQAARAGRQITKLEPRGRAVFALQARDGCPRDDSNAGRRGGGGGGGPRNASDRRE